MTTFGCWIPVARSSSHCVGTYESICNLSIACRKIWLTLSASIPVRVFIIDKYCWMNASCGTTQDSDCAQCSLMLNLLPAELHKILDHMIDRNPTSSTAFGLLHAIHNYPLRYILQHRNGSQTLVLSSSLEDIFSFTPRRHVNLRKLKSVTHSSATRIFYIWWVSICYTLSRYSRTDNCLSIILMSVNFPLLMIIENFLSFYNCIKIIPIT